MTPVKASLLAALAALAAAGAARAEEPIGTWWPDGVVCRAEPSGIECSSNSLCRELRIMDEGPRLSGTRIVLVCDPWPRRSPRFGPAPE